MVLRREVWLIYAVNRLTFSSPIPSADQRYIANNELWCDLANVETKIPVIHNFAIDNGIIRE